MFSAAFKSFGSNISSNYEVSKTPKASLGVWTVFDARKRTTSTSASVFVFDRKSLELGASGFGARSSVTSIRKAQDEVVERLRKEVGSLARLRHPSVLQLVEPAEETRTGGLMFATEPITTSLSSLLAEKDRQEGRGTTETLRSRYMVEEGDGTRRRTEVELDELEIQKGLLQVSKGLEFLHESAGLVHGNLTPDAIYINAQSDWKIAGLSFAGSPDGAQGHHALPPLPLSEVLYLDHRLPPSVQLNLDYTSPDFVLDSAVNPSADIFSLGLVAVALYNSPHKSPLETHGNQASYKRIFSNDSSVPCSQNEFLSSQPLPTGLKQTLPQLLARRPSQRITARNFQQSAYFDNILVSTIRFLDALPAKTSSEKAQFMRGLGRVLPQFPASVLGKKVLTALLDEMKDKELLSLVLNNTFKIIKTIPAGRRLFPEKVLPAFRTTFLTKSNTQERDASKEAGLAVIMENMNLIVDSCSGKEFKDDVLPIINLAMESPSHMLADATLKKLPTILPVLDFSTVKHDLFPCVATVFSRTSSLGIKVSGLEALYVLCGGSKSEKSAPVDDLSGIVHEEKRSTASTTTALDKYTVQEKIVPLIRAIKTKEPPVMMAALDVLRQIGKIADTDFLALDVLPILWSFSLGPLLEIQQFRSFMDLIRAVSSRIEREQARKLQDMSSTSKSPATSSRTTHSEVTNGLHGSANASTSEDDFERLVLGKTNPAKGSTGAAGPASIELGQEIPTFSWSSTPSNHVQKNNAGSSFRSITPDTSSSMSAFPVLQPAGSQGANSSGGISNPIFARTSASASSSSSAAAAAKPGLSSIASLQPTSMQQQPLPPPLPPPPPSSKIPPPSLSSSTSSSFSIPLPPVAPATSAPLSTHSSSAQQQQQQRPQQQQQSLTPLQPPSPHQSIKNNFSSSSSSQSPSSSSLSMMSTQQQHPQHQQHPSSQQTLQTLQTLQTTSSKKSGLDKYQSLL